MKNIPKKIYLTLGSEKPSKDESFNELTGVSWCQDKVDEWDLEYISKSEVDKIIKKIISLQFWSADQDEYLKEVERYLKRKDYNIKLKLTK